MFFWKKIKNISLSYLVEYQRITPPPFFAPFLLDGGRPVRLFCHQFFEEIVSQKQGGETQVFGGMAAVLPAEHGSPQPEQPA